MFLHFSIEEFEVKDEIYTLFNRSSSKVSIVPDPISTFWRTDAFSLYQRTNFLSQRRESQTRELSSFLKLSSLLVNSTDIIARIILLV